MFDLRYHVASLAAVFLALVIGILVGVGISDPVDNAKTGLLEREVASLQKQLDQQVQQTGAVAREQDAARSFINQTYPALVRNRLRGKHVAVVYVGSPNGAMPSAVNRTLINADGQQLRLRVIKVPIDAQQIDKMLAAHPEVGQFTGPGRLEALGRALGAELVLGGDTPLWNVFTDALVAQQGGGTKDPADGVIVVRTAAARRNKPLPPGALLGSRLRRSPGGRGRGERQSPHGHSDLPAGRALVRGRHRHTRRAPLAGAPARRRSVRAVRLEAVRR
jgi:hypothetical protein